MAAPSPPFGPKNTFLHVLAGELSASASGYTDFVGAGKVIEGVAAADFVDNKVGNVISVGDIGQTANTITQGYLGDDTADSVAGAPGRPEVAVVVRTPSAIVDESDIGTTYTVAVTRKKGVNVRVKAFQAELAGFVESTPETGIVQATITFAPQGINHLVNTP